ncbi:NUDIX domain-containing protein [Actinoplanes sp. NPDC023801]|uniref:nucleotide triphosphate diphosphatase NUDT15 n=1 Tax=Actinoplanes sp. NPDC023801 TaxID=3154595 RepID=UPI0033CD81CC
MSAESRLSAASSHRPVVGVGMLVLRADNAVLLGRRIKQGESMTWCLPGGHLEAAESFEQGAERETLEETGLIVTGSRVFGIAVDLAGSGIVAGVAAEHTGGDPAALEPHVFDRWEWYPLDGLPGQLFPASAVLLAMWRREALPAGWSSHYFAG